MADPIIKVTSRSFSTHPLLRCEVSDSFPGVVFNRNNRIYGEEDLGEYIKDADGAVVGLEPITDNVLEVCPNLKIVAKFGVGLDNVDREACRKRGVTVGWTGGVNRRSVSELVISFAIALLHRVVFANAEVRKGEWYQVKGRQLSECTVGIVGCGNVGKDLVKLLQPFNCNILANDILEFKEFSPV